MLDNFKTFQYCALCIRLAMPALTKAYQLYVIYILIYAYKVLSHFLIANVPYEQLYNVRNLLGHC